MPNTASARKRLRQNQGRRLRNRSVKSALRTLIRKVRSSIKEGNVEASETAFREAGKRLDQAAAKSVIHKNQASRLKSRLSKAIKDLKATK
jgi:small subunit ribosomal protein S20